MKSNFLWRYLISVALLGAALTSSAAGQTDKSLGVVCPHTITQSFPTTGTPVTTWTICWNDNPRLSVGPVYFRKSPGAPSVLVVWDLRLSEIFVPYHAGTPRFYDLSDFNFGLTQITTTDCPASQGGTILNGDVCEEVHDRGLMWKDPNTFASRRGEELKLWAVIDAANYLYVDQYAFRDDGFIVANFGATGQIFNNDAHSHSPFWRIDIDLDGPTNSANHMQHIEDISDPSGKATDPSFAILTEQGFTWDARTHDAMVISNSSFKNAQGHLSTYHLVAQPTGGGLTQDFETFTQNDFWVTTYDATETKARKLPTYVAEGASVVNTDIVAWYKGSLHHHPRDEDGVNGASGFVGVTDVMWTGFLLMPNDLFDCSPLYPVPPSCPPTLSSM